MSPSGRLSAAGTLAAGTYKATGTAKDAAGNAGAWSFALTVTATRLVQTAPVTATTPTGKAFSAQLVVSGSHGTLTYAESSWCARSRRSVLGQDFRHGQLGSRDLQGHRDGARQPR